MARTVRDARLETAEARRRLPVRPAPHWRTLVPGKLHLGYRRRRKDSPGSWCFRIYRATDSGSPYRVHPLALADDNQPANGRDVLSFSDAQRLAHEKSQHPASSGPLTVDAAVADYIAELKLTKKTGDEVEAIAARHILPSFGSKRVSDLTTKELKKWHRELATSRALVRTRRGESQRYRAPADSDDRKRARKATANRILTSFKAALNMAFREGLVHSDLEWRRVLPFKDVDAQRPGFLSVAEAIRLLNAADVGTGFRDLVRAALETGCRYGELRRLKVGDLGAGKIAVIGGKTGNRDVVLTEDGQLFFEQLAAGREKGAPLLRRADGEAWKPSQQSRPMLEACKRAKIKPAVGMHALRHTWASLSVEKGMPLIIVAKNLGHRDTRMVEKYYAHLKKNFIDDAIRASAPRFGAVHAGNVKTLRP